MSNIPSSTRIMNSNQKMRCNKQGHKSQAVQFICVDQHCKASTRTGCITCFPEHDGHTQNHLDIDDFFREVHTKEKTVEQEYQTLLTTMDTRKSKETNTKKAQVSFKALMQKVFLFLERHQDFLTHQIQVQYKSQEIHQNFQLKVYHDELSRIKVKPSSQLDHKDVNFLLNFLSSNEFETLIHQQKKTKEQDSEQIQSQIDYIVHTFDEQFNHVMSNLDTLVMEQMGNKHQQLIKTSPKAHTQNSPPQDKRSVTPKRTQTAKFSPPTKFSPGRKNNQLTKTPDKRPRKPKQPAPHRFLFTTPDTGAQPNNKTIDNFIQFVQLNYLKEDLLNDNHEFLTHNYPEVFGSLQHEKITQKDKIQLIQEQRGRIMKILWDNWMIEWLSPALQQGGLNSSIIIKVHEIEDNYQGFLELLEKSLFIHGMVAWLVKQKLNRPKVEYHTWLILAQGTSIKQQSHQHITTKVLVDRVYRLYHIKSAVKRDYKEQHMYDDASENRDLRGLSGFTLAKIMEDSLRGDFKISEDSKVVVKGLIDPNFQTFLMAERLQVYMTLACYSLANQGHAMNIYSLEQQFDQLMINFPSFLTALNGVLREYGDYKPNEQPHTTFQQQVHSDVDFY